MSYHPLSLSIWKRTLSKCHLLLNVHTLNNSKSFFFSCAFDNLKRYSRLSQITPKSWLVTKLVICPSEFHRVKINQKLFDEIRKFWNLVAKSGSRKFSISSKNIFGWFLPYGAQLGKWPALSHDLGVIWVTLKLYMAAGDLKRELRLLTISLLAIHTFSWEKHVFLISESMCFIFNVVILHSSYMWCDMGLFTERWAVSIRN